jgi:arylsulfatase A-like enzyme
MAKKKPNILIVWGDDVGWWNISYNSRGQMGYRTPNIDRVAKEGVALPTTTRNKVAPPAAPPSSPARIRFAPA